MTVPHADQYGPYEIVAPLNAGGMGEVYLARDVRLQRDVALKILPRGISDDADRRRRFVQEARATGALNHPSIVAIYDVSLDGEIPFLVTELVEGTTLRSEVERGALSVKRAIDLAAQIASGLAAAHDAGIVHRDLKPENVMVTHDGRAKILDFGLAKTLPRANHPVSAPPGKQERTETGMVFGTAPYMSPEQARGGVIDYRSDQFSFGIVLYEMIAGLHPFRRDTGVQTLSAIIAEEPRPLTDINRKTPAPLSWIVDRCLAKDPSERYASTSDLERDLGTLRLRMSEAGSDMFSRAPSSRLKAGLRLGTLSALVLVAAAGWWIASLPVPNPYADHVFTPLVVDSGYQGAPAWSPNSKSIAYVAQVDGILEVFTRTLGSTLPAQVTRTSFDCFDPFWSPDGKHLYFHSQAHDKLGLWVVSAAGGDPELVQPNAARATISPNEGSLIFFKQEGDPAERLTLWAAKPPQAEPRKLDVEFDKRDLTDALVRFAPDGSKLLLWAYGYVPAPDQDRRDAFWLLPWPGGVPRNALPLGRRTLDATIAFDWLPDSRHVVLSLGDAKTPDRHLWLADTEREGLEMLTMTPASESSPSVSPDGSRLAFTSEAVDFDLISIPNDGGPSKVLFATSRNEFDPAWAPRQPNFAFVTDRNGSLQLLVRSRDGFEREIVSDALFPDDHTWALGALAFSADGSRIAYQRLGERSGYRVWISTAVSAGPPVEFSPLALGQGRQDAPTWSPNGAWIAYVYGESSAPRWHLVKTRVGGGGESIVLNDHVLPYTRPAWSPDGRSKLFDSRDGLTVIGDDGRNPRVVSEELWIAHEWADARTIYGLRETETRRHFMLVALDITTGRERVVNADLGVIPVANQPIRGLTRTETGAWVTSVARVRSDIYMLEGFSVPKGGLARLKGLFTRP